MITFITEGPLRGTEERSGLPVLVHAVYPGELGVSDVLAMISESDGRARVVPWGSLILDWRWNDKKERWEDVGMPEESPAAAKSEEPTDE